MDIRFRLTIAYLGNRYHGWQVQENAGSIQGEIEMQLQRIFNKEEIRIFGSGRTDAGVHAAGQVAHVDLPASIPPRGLLKALNGRLPEDIRILKASRCSPHFHARFDATSKTYCYRIRWSSAPPTPPWKSQRVAILRRPSNIDAMVEALGIFEGEHDFASFSVRDPEKIGKTTRKIFSATSMLTSTGLKLIFRSNGFLRYQVRRMVGALLEIGDGRHDGKWLSHLLSSPGAGAAMFAAPARGLCLEKVEYGRSEPIVKRGRVDFGGRESDR